MYIVVTQWPDTLGASEGLAFSSLLIQAGKLVSSMHGAKLSSICLSWFQQHASWTIDPFLTG